MKKTLFKKNDIAKILLVAFGVVGFSSFVFSAPPGPTPASGDVADIIDFGKVPQSKNCGGVGLVNTTFSICHDAGTAVNSFATEGLLSLGPIIAEGTLIADLSQMVSVVASDAHDALRLTTGKQQNITTIFTNRNIVGVWSDFLNGFAQGRLGRLDAERLILTEKNPFASYVFGLPQTPADEYRAVSYTNSVGALPNIDIAGTTNLGQGNYCYRAYKDCSGGANAPGGGNMYINKLGRKYTSCRDIDPAEYPQVANMTDPGYFTCGKSRAVPGSHSSSIGYMPTEGYSWNATPQTGNGFCVSPGFVSNAGGDESVAYMPYESADDTFGFGTYIFKDPYLEKPIEDGWHNGGGMSPLDPSIDPGQPFGYGVNWYKTLKGSVVEIGKCFNNGAPAGNNMTLYATNFWIYNNY